MENYKPHQGLQQYNYMGQNCVELYAQDINHDMFRIMEIGIDCYGGVEG